jgi:hypothetical protein
MTLQDIADKVQARLKQATNPSASFDILTLMSELVATLQAGVAPDQRDATIAKLQHEVDALNSLLNNDAVVFTAIKTALGNLNLTEGEIANEIRKNWKHI